VFALDRNRCKRQGSVQTAQADRRARRQIEIRLGQFGGGIAVDDEQRMKDVRFAHPLTRRLNLTPAETRA
jgi:hypothetical protein